MSRTFSERKISEGMPLGSVLRCESTRIESVRIRIDVRIGVYSVYRDNQPHTFRYSKF